MSKPTEPVLVDGVDIDAIHSALAACPGIASVGSNGVSGLTTYLPGRRVPGIRVNPDAVEIEVTAAWGTPVTQTARQTTAVVSSLAPGRRVDVTIADIDLPGETADSSNPSPSESDSS